MSFTEKPTTYEQALDNLTAENWHTERQLVEAELARRDPVVEAAREVAALEDADVPHSAALDRLRAALSENEAER